MKATKFLLASNFVFNIANLPPPATSASPSGHHDQQPASASPQLLSQDLSHHSHLP
ncbi:hypothetical protein DY000_02013253 [Brassica cretica]|uniref:Uncharacterized protein n=1 Tax=Brassica cretica TaxID=69181 RepID=A0ABQ7D3M4_BRACR|nr:hypothetical protein DY000_02013253 [Brassica cretica]